jgi:hypothetical protein
MKARLITMTATLAILASAFAPVALAGRFGK